MIRSSLMRFGAMAGWWLRRGLVGGGVRGRWISCVLNGRRAMCSLLYVVRRLLCDGAVEHVAAGVGGVWGVTPPQTSGVAAPRAKGAELGRADSRSIRGAVRAASPGADGLRRARPILCTLN